MLERNLVRIKVRRTIQLGPPLPNSNLKTNFFALQPAWLVSASTNIKLQCAECHLPHSLNFSFVVRVIDGDCMQKVGKPTGTIGLTDRLVPVEIRNDCTLME